MPAEAISGSLLPPPAAAMGRTFEAESTHAGEIEAISLANNHVDKKKRKKKKNKNNTTDELETDRKRKLEDQQVSENLHIDLKEAQRKDEKKRKMKQNTYDELIGVQGKELGAEVERRKDEKKRKKKQNTYDELIGVQGKQLGSEVEQRKDEKKRKMKQNTYDELIGVQGKELGAEVEQEVVVSGNNTEEVKYASLKTFAESGLPEEVLDCCKKFRSPSPIQSHAWPFLLDGRDFIGIAATGSGKTLAFGVPAIVHIRRLKEEQTSKALPRCLVLSPTRELAQQISTVLSVAGAPCGLKVACLYGGMKKDLQISTLNSGVDIVVGTPGRIIDLIENHICRLRKVSFVVLDEADRMLDLGFEQQVRAILSQTCSDRQVVMFSATWPLPVHQLAQDFMDPNPVKVVVGSQDLSANHDVMQIVEVLDCKSRDRRLIALLEKYHSSRRNRILVFVLYKKEAARVETMLNNSGWKAVSVHGDKSQHDRTHAMDLFKNGKCPLLIATDVASRGLDIPDVEVVINYSFPLTTEDYVHRIGRTGRAGKKGVAHTFFTKENKGLAGELVNVLREAGQIVPDELVKFGTHVKKKESELYGAHFKQIGVDAPKSTRITFGNSDDED